MWAQIGKTLRLGMTSTAAMARLCVFIVVVAVVVLVIYVARAHLPEGVAREQQCGTSDSGVRAVPCGPTPSLRIPVVP